MTSSIYIFSQLQPKKQAISQIVKELKSMYCFFRLLESGGAKIIDANPPFLINIKYKITHAFVTKELSKDFKILNRDKFENVFYPEYIAEYLIQVCTIFII